MQSQKGKYKTSKQNKRSYPIHGAPSPQGVFERVNTGQWCGFKHDFISWIEISEGEHINAYIQGQCHSQINPDSGDLTLGTKPYRHRTLSSRATGAAHSS